MDDIFFDGLPQLVEDSAIGDALPRRVTCKHCARPMNVCVCKYIQRDSTVKTHVLVLQHPAEQNRQLRTVPLLKSGLPEGKCTVIVGKRFKNLNTQLSDKSVLLFPCEGAIKCNEVVPGDYDTLVCLDGTWPQARRMYRKNELLHSLPKIMLNTPQRSVYLIRTQPTNFHLSTLESVAYALQEMENSEGLVERLIFPLKEMVRIQFKYGACAHSTQAEARLIRREEVKNGSQTLTVAPKIQNFDYDQF